MDGQQEGRFFIVIVRDKDGAQFALSRRAAGPDGTPFAGPWGALTESEALELAQAWNDDPRDGGVAETAELFRYDRDPRWTEAYA